VRSDAALSTAKDQEAWDQQAEDQEARDRDMLDRPLRRLIDPSLDAAGRGLVRQGVGADQVTVAGLILGLGMCLAIWSWRICVVPS